MSAFVLSFFALLAAQPALNDTARSGEEEFRLDPKEEFVPATLTADGQAVVAGLNKFGFELYGKLQSSDGDLAISPASVSTAFGLAYAGATGRTASDIAKTLHYPAIGDFHSTFGSLLRTMDLHQNGRTLSVNNALWLQEGMAINPAYQQLVERNYSAGIQRADYRHDPEAARLKINAWVEAKTNDKIKNLLVPGNVTQATRSVLVNTIYFKADWANPFNPQETRQEAFTLATGRAIKRDLMHTQEHFGYAHEAGVSLLSMPYRGRETEMLIILPDEANGLAALERSLNSAKLERLADKMRPAKVRVTLPKFKIEKRFELATTLKELGMTVPFSGQANFPGLIDPSRRQADSAGLVIGDVIHQVFVEVEEKGTEAAAATAIGIVVSAARVAPLKDFRADHPFLFLIRDRRTNAILFIGRFTGEASN